MKTHQKSLILCAILLITITGIAFEKHLSTIVYTKAEAAAPVDPLTHQQRVWEYALEWCESRGVITAVNPKDRDNTPSYYSWQWKPSTFRMFAELYGVIPKGLTDAELRKAMGDYPTEQKVVDQMLVHSKDINWAQQFPDCVLHHIGRPPVVPTASVDKQTQAH